MTPPEPPELTLHVLDEATRSLVRLAAIVTAGSEPQVRAALAGVHRAIPSEWVEELLLQTYLFAGFPRALNATREWRRLEPAASGVSADAGDVTAWRADGEATCSVVYGATYERLRHNIRQLHPLLDDWMIVEGYGKVLSRRGLDLARRELCIVAACAAAGQDRQLHSHLHGARNAGASDQTIDTAVESLGDLLGADRSRSVALLWARVRGK
ncbi:MAG TPA: carboxymuconolactone decarboxylase family protein [Gemmatimonadaceae bacterium]|jgi:4-carboxymuconolactone decarboxylase|nr:carboxymuconolactone decarboxylase family protein [Gemmatimonadaceae bacterium]